MQNRLPACNPTGLTPEILAESLAPFGSWPENGLPEGYFKQSSDEGAVSFYKDNGWLVLHEAIDRAAIEELRARATELCRNETGEVRGVAPADGQLSDEEALQRVLCIHFPHKLSATFKAFLAHPVIVATLQKIIGPDVKAMQSMLFVKASGKPGQAWHQDEDFIPTRDRSLTGVWIALDDATLKNGCLWMHSGSQKAGVLWPQKFHYDHRFDCTHESFGFAWGEAESVPVEVKTGSVVFFNGYTLHRSLSNRARSGFRRALVNHYMSASSLLPWAKPEDKTSMALADFRDVVLVAGRDPYAFKGIEDRSKAFVRADGKGGCVDWNDEAQKKAADAAQSLAGAPAAVSAGMS